MFGRRPTASKRCEPFTRRGGFEREARVARMLEGLGFDAERREKPLSTLSGGWRMRVELAKLLLAALLVLLAVFAPALFMLAWPALAAGAVASLAIGVAQALRPEGEAGEGTLTLPPPDDIWFAVVFGALLAVFAVGIHYAELFFGDAGLYALAAISGTFDVDVFTLSAARSAGQAASTKSLRYCFAVGETSVATTSSPLAK